MLYWSVLIDYSDLIQPTCIKYVLSIIVIAEVGIYICKVEHSNLEVT